MIAVIGLETGWLPWQIGELYLDEQDELGMVWWRNQIDEQNKATTTKK